jgi:hypothetical protein
MTAARRQKDLTRAHDPRDDETSEPRCLDGCQLTFAEQRYAYLVVSMPDPTLPDALSQAEREVARLVVLGTSIRGGWRSESDR